MTRSKIVMVYLDFKCHGSRSSIAELFGLGLSVRLILFMTRDLECSGVTRAEIPGSEDQPSSFAPLLMFDHDNLRWQCCFRERGRVDPHAVWKTQYPSSLSFSSLLYPGAMLLWYNSQITHFHSILPFGMCTGAFQHPPSQTLAVYHYYPEMDYNKRLTIEAMENACTSQNHKLLTHR
jgi:hypothetical protein